ncbi:MULTISPECIES: hypothetical protein [Lactobacillus]|jgi:hypothetical protein|uniref:Uncharacterized protein n=2 Tax=Lactobacillus TaxID=1578 RepID=A0AAP3M429_9LACO|nr:MULTISPECIES: hypothetical protein [Lactobacillus]YP_002455803.1 hypothetical protein Lv-1_gp14 [Lactobacillus phage Lv-1]DAS59760.1 MAG TPA: hypothetical protein [Caudoviricetes sp.]ACJ68915.1 hypothetical protein [Lactobacillus phage Lv-1]APT14759.1 hypothetical protein BUE77_04770 [Lactobacillus jensenii]EEX26655.1 hypothetical protein HMPREF0527_01494 [Lactobacillus jensenii SJ-7A-US]KAA9322942.1 hypothetical protein F6H94_04085 [Lactobacillus jensenii]
MAEEQTTEIKDTNVKQADGMYHYYISTATRGGDITFQTFITEQKIENNLYPIIVTPPDASIKNPVFDWTNIKWVEVDSATLNAKIAAVADDVQALTKSVTTIQTQNQENTKENAQITKTLDGLNANMGNLTSMMSIISSKLIPGASTTSEGGQN